MPDDALEKFIEDLKKPKSAAPRDPEFEEREQKLYVRQLAERDALQKQQREETARVGASKQLEQRHDQEIAKLTEKFEKQRKIFYRDNTPQKTAAVQDPNFIAKVPFTEDPEFKKLQRDLQLRQEQETKKLLDQQTQQRIEFGRQQGVTRQQLDENYQRQLLDREAQTRKFRVEQDRYTREYHDAKVIREEMRDKEKREALERGQDGPKRSR